MDIDSMAKQLMGQAEENYRKYGGLATITLFIVKDQIAVLPIELMDLFATDKARYVDAVRYLVKENPPDAVVLICEAWFLDDIKDGKIEQPSKSPKRKECAFLTVDTRDKQITYINEIKNKKLSEWRIFGTHNKMDHTEGNMQMYGNFTDFYSTSSVLNVPVDMMEKAENETKEVPKIDEE